MSSTEAGATAEARERHWTKTSRLNTIVMILWVLFAIVIPFFAAPLNSFTFLGFPFGYYMCVQGSLIAFVALIWIQNWRQDQIDDEYGLGD
ncbi:MAG: DUF4212 domain-containing protein [Rhizobiaceae bacterium]|nr:DUF4212 domain-containing protein [Rhizobiaceae bacterium]MCV0406247.1 DUF4212 domain-containing protein [Rhizobiaceae bacterium]